MVFEITGSCVKGHAPQWPRACHAVGNLVLAPGVARHRVIALHAVEHSDVVDEAIEYLLSSTFSALRSLVENMLLYALKEEELIHRQVVIKSL